MTPVLRKVRFILRLKVLLGVTRNATRQNILSDAFFTETCSESSLEDELQKFDPHPEHPKYNRRVNGILQDRITGMWIVQKKKVIKISAYRKLLIPQGQKEPFGHAVIDYMSRNRKPGLLKKKK
ncbi:hypothetical protein CDAR_256171 [Caerostris darwini]|uniref:Uncharacterized protein n=1 Tax=Caerostris darwini TaxID=1538125 RepID=A0AAV4R204_9ARAC|nr:hypothetical protein CDAR_256171 [Caerostris darwini]